MADASSANGAVPMRVLVTGATGFVGRRLCESLGALGHEVVRALRKPAAETPAGAVDVVVGDVDGGTDWSAALQGVQAVAHLAARVHVMRDTPEGAAAHRRVNADGTARLAAQAFAAGVRRVVFLSSVKVNGEGRAKAYRVDEAPAPVDPYGLSKLEAEQRLFDAARSAGAEAVVIRPPLVYGPGVKGNFARLLAAVDRGLPLPLGAIDNRRSLVSVWNLCDLVATCLVHRDAAGGVFFAADDRDVSTPELVELIASALRRRARLWRVPPALLRLPFAAIGRGGDIDRLVESLCVDRAAAAERLGWRPPVPIAVGIERTAQAWLAARRGAS
jgi:nucleoside-diphosphate-sugar epimerase